MKKLITTLLGVIVAGAFIASAQNNRVAWIPTTVSEITNYVKAEINTISPMVAMSTANGGYTGINLLRGFGGDRMTGSWDVEAVTMVELRKYVNYFLTNSDGYSTPPREGQTYFVEVSWTGRYNDAGDSDVYGFNGIIYVPSKSPEFTLQKVDGKFVAPPEAFQLTPDWLAHSVGISAVGSQPKWVDYFNHFGSPYTGEDWSEQTINGLSLTCPGADVRNGFIHLQGGFIREANLLPLTYPEAYSTITVWYDTDRIDGTEWRWDGTGVHKREILPRQLGITPTSSGGFRVTLSGVKSGEVYVLESIALSPTKVLGGLGSKTVDEQGVATWVVAPTEFEQLGLFRARLEATR